MGQQQQCHHGVHRPVGNLAPCRASRLAQPWGQVTELGCCQLRTEGCRQGRGGAEGRRLCRFS